MACIDFRDTLIIFVVVLFLLTFNPSLNANAENTTSLSGQVVDADGQPVSGLTLSVKPVRIDQRQYKLTSPLPFSSWSRVVTDKEGRFTFNNIDPVKSQLIMFPEHGSEYELISITIGDVTFYSIAFRRSMPTWFGKLTFSVEPGEHLTNMIVNVKTPRMRIRGRVLYEDGTPLISEEVTLTISSTSYRSSATGSGSSSRRSRYNYYTDNEGYFVTYTQDRAAEYIVSMTYKGFFAESDTIILEEGERYDDLIFTVKNVERMKAREAVWIGNPTNGHAYKKIQCSSWEDAKAKAAAENAYLVAINDDVEQKWLEGAFPELAFYWIGLVVPNNDSQWKWDNGSTLVYSNWRKGLKPDISTSDESDVPIVLEFASKKWLPIDANSPFQSLVRHAILEKEDIDIPTPETQK